MRRYLVVTDHYMGAPKTARAVHALDARGDATFEVLVSADRPHNGDARTEDGERLRAYRRLRRILTQLDAPGTPAIGHVSEELRAIDAVTATTRVRHYDGIVVPGPERGLMRWLHLDLPHRVARRTHLPVRVVSG